MESGLKEAENAVAWVDPGGEREGEREEKRQELVKQREGGDKEVEREREKRERQRDRERKER